MSNVAEVGRCIVFSTIAAVGSGLLMMPQKFLDVGYVSSGIFIAIMALITAVSLFLIGQTMIYLKNEKVDPSFGSMAHSFNRQFKHFVDSSLILSNGCTSFMFYKIFVDHLVTFAKNFFGEDKVTKMVKIIFCVCSSGILAFLMNLEDLSFLGYLFYANVTSAFLYVISIIRYGILYPSKTVDVASFTGFGPLLKNAGAFVLAMHCQYSFPALLSEMSSENLTTSNVLIVSICSSLLSAFIFFCGGYFGIRIFGINKQYNMSTEYLIDSDSYISQMIKSDNGSSFLRILPAIGFTLIFLFGIPIMMSTVIPVLLKLIGLGCDDNKKGRFGLSLGFSVAFVIFYLSELEVGTIANVIGAIFTNSMSFMIPGFFGLFTPCDKTIKGLSVFLMGFSALVMIGLIGSIFKDLFISKPTVV